MIIPSDAIGRRTELVGVVANGICIGAAQIVGETAATCCGIIWINFSGVHRRLSRWIGGIRSRWAAGGSQAATCCPPTPVPVPPLPPVPVPPVAPPPAPPPWALAVNARKSPVEIETIANIVVFIFLLSEDFLRAFRTKSSKSINARRDTSQIGSAAHNLMGAIQGVGVHPIRGAYRARLALKKRKVFMKYSAKIFARVGGSFIVAGFLAAGHAGAADSSLSHAAKSFINEASEGNQGEIAMAQLAQQKSENPQVKQLAQMIQKDHQQAQKKLQTIAQAHGVTLDQGLTFSQKRAQAKLEKLTGSDFDQQYTKNMLEDHVTDLNKFQKASEKIQEEDVRQYALQTIPKLQEHLQHTEVVAKAVGVDPATISSITSKAPAMGGAGENQEKGRGAGQK